jgi:uncharacterized membrane protein YgdD (TMEM256/DUF423 family)
MHKTFIAVGAVLGALAVAIGAFAAHGLKKIMDPEFVQLIETGVKYQFYHAFGLIAIGIIAQQMPSIFFKWAGRLFILGTILFSGSLYALSIIKQNDLTHFNWVGAITPLGGLSFITGWLLLALAVLRNR